MHSDSKASLFSIPNDQALETPCHLRDAAQYSDIFVANMKWTSISLFFL